jgi:UDP-glucose 4-epimerase
MRLLLTGATGLIGGRLLSRLIGRHDVVVLGRRRPETVPRGAIEFIEHDLANALDSRILPARIDAVLHLAQPRRYRDFPDRAREILALNTTSTVDLLDYARSAGAARFLYASSGGVYGFRAAPVREDDAPAPSTFYLRSKYCAELLASAYRAYMRVIVLRYFFVFGEGQRDLLIPRLIQGILEGNGIPLAGHCGIRLTPTYVESAAEATAAAVEAEIDGVVNVAGSEVWTVRDICDCLASALDVPARFEPNTLAYDGDLVADTARMATLLKTHHHPIDEALRTVGRDFVARRAADAG